MRRHLSTATATASAASPRRRLLRSLLLAGSLPSASSSALPPSSPASSSNASPSSRSRPGAHPQSLTTLPEAHSRNLPEVWFNATFPSRSGGFGSGLGGATQPGGKPPDERTLKLGKSKSPAAVSAFICISLTVLRTALRILQERLPTLLQSPLPSEILSPTISLHLFPSTHPHLPVVSGRVAYIAALWTSPLAWNRVPLVGNVKLEILSERMSKQPLHAAARRAGAGDEQLVVRWRTVGKSGISPPLGPPATASSSSSPPPSVGASQAVGDPKEFTGLFIFEFDGEGRVLSHTIEHVAEGGDWGRSVGARFVGLTDWLLGGIKGGNGSGENTPLPAFEMQDPRKMR